jgi:F-type H+-transporting ATP synthase subunit e
MASTGVNVRSCFTFIFPYALRSTEIYSILSFSPFYIKLTELIIPQVLRYSALAAGVFYGLYHQASLTASAKLSAINREYEHKQSLIEKAKAEYSKKNMPAEKKTESGDSTFKLLPSDNTWKLDLLLWIPSYISFDGRNIILLAFKVNTDYAPIVIRDPMDSRFDLEAYLNVVSAEAK